MWVFIFIFVRTLVIYLWIHLVIFPVQEPFLQSSLKSWKISWFCWNKKLFFFFLLSQASASCNCLTLFLLVSFLILLLWFHFKIEFNISELCSIVAAFTCSRRQLANYQEVNTLFQKIVHKKFIWDKNASHRVFDQLSCVRQCFDFLVALQLFGDQYNHHNHKVKGVLRDTARATTTNQPTKQGTKWASNRQKCQIRAKFGVFEQTILIITGEIKSFGTHIR